MTFGVHCKTADGADLIVDVEAADADAAVALVKAHRRLFYGSGDGAGRWLASRRPSDTIVEVGAAVRAS